MLTLRTVTALIVEGLHRVISPYRNRTVIINSADGILLRLLVINLRRAYRNPVCSPLTARMWPVPLPLKSLRTSSLISVLSPKTAPLINALQSSSLNTSRKLSLIRYRRLIYPP